MLSNVKRTQASAQWEHILNNVVLGRILVHASLLHWHFLKAEHVFSPRLTDGLIDLIDSYARCTLSQVATWPLKLLKLLLGFVKIVLCISCPLPKKTKHDAPFHKLQFAHLTCAMSLKCHSSWCNSTKDILQHFLCACILLLPSN